MEEYNKLTNDEKWFLFYNRCYIQAMEKAGRDKTQHQIIRAAYRLGKTIKMKINIIKNKHCE